MSRTLLELLDWFFLVFHTLFTLFNCTGWAFRATRRLNLATLLLTGASWGILGIWYGFGYCPCTDWHWQVREALGRPIDSPTYIHFLVRTLTGIDAEVDLVIRATLGVYLSSLGLSLLFNLRDLLRKRRERRGEHRRIAHPREEKPPHHRRGRSHQDQTH